MKNIITTVALLLAVSLAAFAQQDDNLGPSKLMQNHNIFSGADAPNAGIGLKIGVNHSRLRGKDSDAMGNLSGHTNFHAGAFAQFSITNFFSIQPEVMYTRRGYELNNTTFRFNSFDLPVLFAFNVLEYLNIHFGPQVGYVIAAKENGIEVDVDRYEVLNYGAAAGTEVRIGRIRIGARYNLFLNDLRERDTAGNPISEDVKFNVVQGYIGFGW